MHSRSTDSTLRCVRVSLTLYFAAHCTPDAHFTLFISTFSLSVLIRILWAILLVFPLLCNVTFKSSQPATLRLRIRQVKKKSNFSCSIVASSWLHFFFLYPIRRKKKKKRAHRHFTVWFPILGGCVVCVCVCRVRVVRNICQQNTVFVLPVSGVWANGRLFHMRQDKSEVK